LLVTWCTAQNFISLQKYLFFGSETLQSNGKKLNSKVILLATIAVILTVTVATAGFLSVNRGNPIDANNNLQTDTPPPQQSNEPTDEAAPTNTPQPTAQSSTAQSSSSGGSSSSGVTTDGVIAYSDSSYTQTLTSIQWGTIPAGSSIERTIYLKNPQSSPLTLNLSTSNWNPAGAANFITITWNKENQVLGGGQSTTATITLAVASNISSISDFSVKISITGS
jgi:hypothetical protein